MFDHDYDKFPELTNVQLQDFGFSSPHEQIERDFVATVVKVHDGDTITLRTDFRDFDFPLRFLDIDAPELNEGGEEAREWVKEKVLGKEVDIHIDPLNRVGKYGRLLGRVYFLGMSIGEEMLHLGMVKKFGEKKEGEVPELEKELNPKKWFSI